MWVLAMATVACARHPSGREIADQARARQNYQLHCMGCHGENGAGFEGHVPDMRQDLARLAGLPDGRMYLLRVPGVTQSSLEPALVAEVLNYTLREFGGTAVARRLQPFSAAEVALARSVPLLEITGTRAGILRGGGLQ